MNVSNNQRLLKSYIWFMRECSSCHYENSHSRLIKVCETNNIKGTLWVLLKKLKTRGEQNICTLVLWEAKYSAADCWHGNASELACVTDTKRLPNCTVKEIFLVLLTALPNWTYKSRIKSLLLLLLV